MTQAMCTSFKKELFSAVHNFNAAGGHAFKVALYTATAVLDATTTAYSATNEVASAGYVAGGFALTNVDPAMSGTTAYVTFAANPLWTGVTFTPTQALVYNTSAGNKSVAVLDFGGAQSITAGVLQINLPPTGPNTAFLRLV